MSGMQEAPGTAECTYAQTDRIPAEANNHELPQKGDLGRAPGDSAVQTIQHQTSEDERNRAEQNKELTSTMMPQITASNGKRHPHARSRPAYRKVFCRSPRVQKGNDNFDDQIRIFKRREDLRECLIPGMIGGISQEACEGWRRQAVGRYSRFLGKVKLGLCKDCKYFSGPAILD